VSLLIEDKTVAEYEQWLNRGASSTETSLPTGGVFAEEFDPLKGDFTFDRYAFETLSEWADCLW